MDFNSFQIPTAAESSLLQTSFKDIDVVDDASVEPFKDAVELATDNPKFGGNTLNGLSP